MPPGSSERGAPLGGEEREARRAVEAVWRIEAAKLIGTLARIVGDVGLAEDLAQDAFVDALRRWPQSGVPDNPGAWLMAAAKYRAIDALRRAKRLGSKQELLASELGRQLAIDAADLAPALAEQIEDDVLRLMFTCCHPLLSTEAQVALTLRLVGGLTTAEIARSFIIAEGTIAQRIVRAKRSLGEAKVPFEVPSRDELAGRLGSVLDVIYLVFNEGYAASAGEDWIRPALCEEGLRLGRMLAELVPGEGEVHGLVALMELQASRTPARTRASGEPILLLDQDRALWDRLLIGRGLAALARAERLGGPLGPFALQAAIGACHARARTAAETDWPRIAALYDALAQASPSPVIELNRAVAVGMAFGAPAGLALVERLLDDETLATYHLLPSVHGDLLARLGCPEEAAIQFDRAAELTKNARERELLRTRAADCRAAPRPGADQPMSSSTSVMPSASMR
jgi:RNA polymerase sigma factor (sigma-70 family)